MNAPKRPENRTATPRLENEILLGVLDAVHREAAISQRTISKEVGVALGLANAYLKRCVRKGWIKVRQVPRRRYLYYLTAQGFAEKTRLTGEYLSSSFNFFRRARSQLAELMAECNDRGWKRIVFVGISDLAEIGIISAHEAGLELVGVIDSASDGGSFHGIPVYASLDKCPKVDAALMTTLDKPYPIYERLQEKIEPSRILVPPLLRMAMPAINRDEVEAAE